MKGIARPAAKAAVILGTRIDALGMDDVMARACALAQGARPSQIITANVDQLVGNRSRPALRAIYRDAALTVPDGVPLLWAARFLATPLPERVNGTDLMERLCAMAAGKGLSVFLLGGPEGCAAAAARRLQERFPALRVAGCHCPPCGFEKRPAETEAIRALLQERKPAVLFVSLGYPKGVTWIARHLSACGVPLAVEVGSSFLYLAGWMRRAPRWMQEHGLEWLWRLAHEPRRLWKRYLLRDLPFFYHLLRQELSPAGSGGEQPESGPDPGRPEETILP
jgi:N-acetylglucosaminyldiphosphoundecaprenol N-acetyl-beta-D-mannosaminyltransferase